MKALKLLIALCLALFASCADNTNPLNNKSNEPNQLVEIKITVVLPDGWNPVENSVLEHQYMKGTASFMIKNESMLDGKNLDDAVIDAKTNIKKYFDGTDFSDTESIKVDGYDAKSITYTYLVAAGGMTLKMKMQGVYTMVSNKCYLISFGDMESNFDNLSADIESILKGIKFIT